MIKAIENLEFNLVVATEQTEYAGMIISRSSKNYAEIQKHYLSLQTTIQFSTFPILMMN